MKARSWESARRTSSRTRTGRPPASRARPWRWSGSRRSGSTPARSATSPASNCYIESSPSNDRLVYITAAEAAAYFDEIEAGGLGTREIGFTGGEPFMNPHLIAMVERCAAARLRGAAAHQCHAADAAAQGQARAARPQRALRPAPDDPRQPRSLRPRPARGRAGRAHVGAHDRGARLALAERLQDRNRRAHLLERGARRRRARATRA